MPWVDKNYVKAAEETAKKLADTQALLAGTKVQLTQSKADLYLARSVMSARCSREFESRRRAV